MKRGGIVTLILMAMMFAGASLPAAEVSAARKTAANLNAAIPDARANFIDHESTCTSDLAASRSALGNTRAAVSDSNPYKYDNWISLRNQPSVTTTGLYPAGNVSVQLQFNQYLFLCGVVMSPASGGATSTASNRVTNSRYPNDRNPVRSSGSINRADLIQKDARVMSATVVSGGGSITNMSGQTRYVRSENDSRYSAGTTIPFTYNANLSETTTVRIRIVVREVRSYYDIPSSGNATIICDHESGSGSISGVSGFNSVSQAFNDSRCNRDIERTYSIQVRVTPPSTWALSLNSQNRVRPSGSGSYGSYGNYHEGNAPRTVHPGDNVQWQHAISNSGNATARYERWRDRKGLDTASYILVGSHITNQSLGAGATVRYPLDSSNVNYTIRAADIGKTICERYAVEGRSNSNGSRLYSIGSCVYVAPDWTISGTTTMSVNGTTRTGTNASPTTVRTGDRVNWTQTLRNNGPTATHRTVTVSTLVQDYNASTNAVMSTSLFSTTNIGAPWASGASRSWQNGTAANGYTYTIRATTYRADGSVNVRGDVGKKLCRRLQWNPTRWNDNNSALTYSTQRCVVVPYNYNLVPDLDGPTGSITPGGTIPDIYPTIRNQVPTNPSQTTETDNNIEWQIGRIDIAPGGATPTGAANNRTPQQNYGPNWDFKDGETNTSFPPGSTLLDLLRNEVVPIGTPIGTKICFTLSVRPYNATTTNWRHGEPLCLGVNAHPTVQVLGNDLRVGSAFQGGTNLNAGVRGVIRPTNASWGEYGVIAPSTITNFASQSGANGGSTGTMNTWNKLTFANDGTGAGCGLTNGCFSGTTNLGSLPNVRSAVVGITYNGAALNYNRGGASFNSSTIPGIIGGADMNNFSRSAAITTTGTITIDADIIYRNSVAGERNIPQLILIANNINIRGDVNRIDAWLIATGTINTCNDVAQTALRSTNCNEQLVVNGAVMANQLLMNRTHYDTANPANPAETFNLQGSSYVWASNVTRQSGVWQTVYSTDLPPRY